MILPWRPVAIHREWLADGPPIQTSLTERETAELQRLATGANVIEVGAAFGYSTVAMALVARTVMSVDPHTAHDSRAALESNLISYGVWNKVAVYRGLSAEFLPTLPAATYYTLAFIDGDHTAPAVEHDITQALRLVRPGGHIAVHDYGEDNCPDVKPVCDRLLPGGTLTDTLWVVRC